MLLLLLLSAMDSQVELRNETGACLDVKGYDAGVRDEVMLYPCDGHRDQLWTWQPDASGFGPIKNRKQDNRCLDVKGYDGKLSDPVILYTCEAKPDQMWKLANGQLINQKQNLCLGLQGNKTAARTLAELTTCTQSPQRWRTRQPVLAFTSDPYNAATKRDGTLHDVMYDLIKGSAASADEPPRLGFYMWNADQPTADTWAPCPTFTPGVAPDEPAATAPHSPSCINRALANLAPAGTKLFFDIDYFDAKSQVDALTDMLKGPGRVSVVYPAYKYAYHLAPREACTGAVCPTLDPPGTGQIVRDASNKVHDKSMVFRRVDVSKAANEALRRYGTLEWVVVEASSNVWPSQYRQANDLVVLHGDEALYRHRRAGLERLYEKLETRPKTSEMTFDKKREPDLTDESFGSVRSYYFPRDGDVVATLIDKMQKCGGTPATIHVGMAYFTRTAVASALVRAKQRGLTVNVLLREWKALKNGVMVPKEEQQDRIAQLRAAQIPVAILPNIDALQLHSKYMAFSGCYENKETKTVWTGSHNFTGKALDTNSETYSRIDDAQTYDTYLAHWTALSTQAVAEK